MQLIIYETTHHENLPALLDLALSCSRNTVVFLDEMAYGNLQTESSPENRWPGVLFIQRTNGVSNRDFIRHLFAFIRQNNTATENIHLHLSSLSNNYLFFALKLIRRPRIQVSLTVHEINLYRYLFFRNLRDLTESIAKYYLHRRIRKFRALIPRMKTELEKYFPRADTQFIPSRFYTRVQVNAKGTPIKIVVPGSVESRRRDYDFLIRFAENHLKKPENKFHVELILLGYSGTEYGKNILDRLVGISSDYLKVTYFDHPVSAAEYERQIHGSKIIWSPITVKTVGSRGQREIYGITKSPGLTADLIQFPKPTLVPAEFQIPFYFEHCMISYEGETDLLGHIARIAGESDSIWFQKAEEDLLDLVPDLFITAFEKLMT
jgi:hypothetical protein